MKNQMNCRLLGTNRFCTQMTVQKLYDRAKIIWDQFLAIYIFISIILTPFNLAFRDYRFKNPKYSNFVYSLDAVFIIDIFMNFISAY